MTEHWLRTNEHEEAISALEAVADWTGRVERDIGYYSVEKLDSFLNLYKKAQSDTMLFFVHSKKVIPSRTLGRSMKKLNSLRNDFVHFLRESGILWSDTYAGMGPYRSLAET